MLTIRHIHYKRTYERTDPDNRKDSLYKTLRKLQLHFSIIVKDTERYELNYEIILKQI